MSAGKSRSSSVRLASHSPRSGREACLDVRHAEGTDQTGKACVANLPRSSVLVNSQGIMNELESGTLQVNLDSKLNASEKTFLGNANLQSLAWQADFDSRLLALEQLKTDFANKVAIFEDMEDAKQRSLAWQAGFDRRLLMLEQHKQDYSNKLAAFEECIANLLELGEFKDQEDRLSVIEESTANFLKFSESKDQQYLDLKGEVVKLKTIVSELEENLGLPCAPEAIDPKHIEQTRHNNNLTVPPEDRSALISKSVGGISLAHDREHVLQHGPDQQTKATPTTTLTHRLCVVECHIDMIASILKHVEDKFSSLNNQVLTRSEVRSKGDRVMRKRSDGKSNSSRDTLWISQEAYEPHGTAPSPDAALLGITDLDNIAVNDQHSQIQLLLARASKHLDEAPPLGDCTFCWTFPTIIEESDTAAEGSTD